MNSADFNNGIDMWFDDVRAAATLKFRELVWDLFVTVVRETPQWSGKAVANWNISIGSVGSRYDGSLGDDNEVGRTSFYDNDKFYSHAPHSKGVSKWIDVALNANRPTVGAIKLTDKVFIYNLTTGDDGDSYLAGFQTNVDWPTKLREVNRPYETVQQSVQIVTNKWMTKGMNLDRTISI